MTTTYFNLKNQALLFSFMALVAISCGDDATENDKSDNIVVEQKNPNKNQLLELDGKVFSIPSPIQTAFLIKNSGMTYNKDVLNVPSKVTSYSTNFKKAVNLGIYGADLGYVTLYDQTQDAISFLTAVKTLGDDLGVSNAFDMELVERFEKNIGNQDSILSLVSEAYKSSDRYLKSNDQNDISALILAGGWIESLYFTTNSAKLTSNKEIINRVGEQKNTVYNLVQLLTPYYNKPEFSTLVDNLMELNELFEKVEVTYTYIKPTVDVAKKTTTINSTTTVVISNELLGQITEKIAKIRAEAIN
ncbi:MAG: hypothetical protein K0B10_01385 [Vicingaceae bacterium]|nr:hypothetical protein [Vicingaceae bacterium]